jgi:hypothetical protein
MANEIDYEAWNKIQAECVLPSPFEVNEPPVPTVIPTLPVVPPIPATDSGIPGSPNPPSNPHHPSPHPLCQPCIGSTPLSKPPVVIIPSKHHREPSLKLDREEGSSTKPTPVPQRCPAGPLRIMVPHSGPQPIDRLPPPTSSEKLKIVSTQHLSFLSPSYSKF